MGRRSDPAWRDRAALDLLTRRVLPTLPSLHAGPLLIAGEPSPGFDVDGGRRVVRWDRMASRRGAGTTLPSASDIAVAAVRMARSRAALDFTVRAVASTVRKGGLLLVYGANDEGAGAVTRELGELGIEARTWASGGRCRVVGGVLDRPPETLALSDVQLVAPIDLPGVGERDWLGYPGVFAAGRLDAGTRLLLRTLSRIPPETAVLDYGAGTGLIAAAAAGLGAEDMTLLEPDALAAEAARRNVPGGRVVEGAGWPPLEGTRFDLILSNPPYHQGKAETVQPVLDFIRGAAAHLERRGRIRFVVQRRLPVEHDLTQRFDHVEVVADDGPYRVWEAWRTLSPGEGGSEAADADGSHMDLNRGN